MDPATIMTQNAQTAHAEKLRLRALSRRNPALRRYLASSGNATETAETASAKKGRGR